MEDVSLKYREKMLRKQATFRRRYSYIFNDVADQFAALANDPMAKFTKAYQFPKTIEKKIANITEQFYDQAYRMTEQEITTAWEYSNAKNDEIVHNYLRTLTTIKTAQAAAYLLPNTEALQSFIARDRGTGTLSDAIWKIAEQLRAEMEVQLGLGIANGDSAQVISRRIRQYLNNPDALFRRIRDEKGILQPSKRMQEYSPGRGVYKSAFKNAMRVARSETNMAYLLADHIRWSQMDMVIGVKVSLSAQHRIIDICDDCQGVYPKDFIFIGWHPQCMCHAVPILSPEEDFLRYLDTGEWIQPTNITNYPTGFEDHVRQNFDRYSNYKNPPYWMRDNKAVVTTIMKGEHAASNVRETGTIARIAKKAID